MRVNLKFFQLASDALIPLLGYFLWDWNLYFIVLFYLLDYLVYEVFMHLKAKKIREIQGDHSVNWFKLGLISSLLLLVNLLLVHLTMESIVPNINFSIEIVAFWQYKDLGIEQGYVLLPLIAFTGYQRYKMEFLMTGIFQKISIHRLFKNHIQAQLIALGCITLAFGLSHLIRLPELVYIIGIIALSGAYQILRK